MKKHKIVEETIQLREKEKHYTLLVLQNLLKIEEERLYLDYNCNSLFSFCIKFLMYTEAEAAANIQTMRLIKQNKEVEEKIVNGDLSISSAATIQRFFVEEEKKEGKVFTREEKAKIVENMSKKSVRETKAALNEIRTVPKTIKYSIEVDEETYKKFMSIANDMGTDDNSKIISNLVDEHQELHELKLKKIKDKNTKLDTPTNKDQQNQNSRYIPQSVKDKVLERSSGQCEFISPITGERCSVKHHLNFDHISPWALSRDNTVLNIRVLCSHHNIRQAIKFFGSSKMNQYINK